MNFRIRALAFIAAATLGSGAASAQDAQETPTANRTHTVKKGDTLWDIARIYLNDPFLWPEIYRLNTSVVEDPHWIYPGETLHIPDGAVSVAQDQLEMAPTKKVSEQRAPGLSAGPTVFSNGGRRPGARSVGMTAMHPPNAVRRGEFYASPWVDRIGGPQGAGQVVGVADLPGTAARSPETRIAAHSRAYITLPKGATAAPGDRFLTYTTSVQLHDAQVMLPTGVIEVERSENGQATTVLVVEEYENIDVGNGVIPIEQFDVPEDARPSAIDNGAEARVVYLPSETVLPSIGYYVVLDATSKAGLKVGDQFTLYEPRAPLGNGIVLPEEKIALAQVTRVTDRGAAALIVDQRQPAIHPGAFARLTARMP